MQQYIFPDREKWEEIIRRPVSDPAMIERPVQKILDKVKRQGDKALRKFSKEFDGVILKNFQVSEKEMREADKLVDDSLKTAILQAKQNIETFHSAQWQEFPPVETMPGVVCWQRPAPIERIGLYIPGGSAPLFSTVLMLGVPPAIAGCKEIVLCTPPSKDGKVHPAILFAARCCGIEKIYKVGGAQAIAAMAFGTATIPKVFKIFGPGNQYVTTAKQLVSTQGVAIDMPAGPSEVLIIADETAVPAFVAADLLSQAEHGPDSQVLLVTTAKQVADSVLQAIDVQLDQLPRRDIAWQALQNSKAIVVNTMDDALELSNRYAPEHLIIASDNAQDYTNSINSAGSVFLGNYSPESVGDYASGTNHTLPTNGYAAMYSGLSLDSFTKKISFQHLTKTGLQNISTTVITMASAEGLDAHANAVSIRIKN